MSAADTMVAAGWENEGRRLSPLIDTVAAVVIVGSDPNAAAQVALGAARTQAEHRRVVIGDLIGELEFLESLIPRHDVHGLSDSFTYGISLNRVGYKVAESDNLYVMPSGSEPVATEAIIGHPRWQRLVVGFREVGALLLLVAQPTAPSLDRLIDVTDGAVLVGDTRLESPGHVIARARERADATAAVAAHPEAHDRASPLVPVAASAHPDRRGDARVSGARSWAVVGVTLVLATLTFGGISITRALRARTVEAAAAGQVIPELPVQNAPAPPAAEPAPPVENPGDSARAARYSVVIVAANTTAGANDNLRRVSGLPAATAAPAIDGGALWYKVFVGAFRDRAAAEALRDSLHARAGATDLVEPIASLPFALLIAEAIPRDSMTSMRSRHEAHGISTYALVQEDGTVRLYAGAFATPEEAMHLAPDLRRAGITPRIVYRTGRPL